MLQKSKAVASQWGVPGMQCTRAQRYVWARNLIDFLQVKLTAYKNKFGNSFIELYEKQNVQHHAISIDRHSDRLQRHVCRMAVSCWRYVAVVVVLWCPASLSASVTALR